MKHIESIEIKLWFPNEIAKNETVDAALREWLKGIATQAMMAGAGVRIEVNGELAIIGSGSAEEPN